jgi:hypothetical protein
VKTTNLTRIIPITNEAVMRKSVKVLTKQTKQTKQTP